MLTIKDFLSFNKHCCETYHDCKACSIFGDDICCIFRAKSSEDIQEVINLAMRLEKGAEQGTESHKKDPLDGIAKALTDIEHELHDMKRILDKRRT